MTHLSPTDRRSDRRLAALAESASAEFERRFGRPPRWIAAAPGRVNLIGEHTDYNGGFVLPMAIDRYLAIAAAPGGTAGEARIESVELGRSATVRVGGELAPGPVAWSSYVQGVVAGFVERGLAPQPFDAVIRSDVPLGGGLSSSAALEVATATLLEAMTGQVLDPLEKARLCQSAEHRYAGMPCGVMDQMTSVLGRAGALMLLDCRSLAVQHVPLADPAVTVLVADSGVQHELVAGEYAARRRQCEAAADALGVAVLRDATEEQLEAARGTMEPSAYKRARHVIGEIRRTLDTAAALGRGDYRAAGRLMYQGHASMRDDFEASCRELDLLVEAAAALGEAGGVFGSRMTGGGFGGCTVSLVRSEAVDSIRENLQDRLTSETGRRPTVFATPPAQGAMVLGAE